jgi:HEPN domain-containing protein
VIRRRKRQFSLGVAFEYTHDLRRLIAEVTAAVGEFPFDIAEVVALTEHAVPLRYDEILDAEPLDREATVALVDEVGGWAETQLSAAADDEGGEENAAP